MESQGTSWKPWQLTEFDRIPQNTTEPDRTFWNIKEPEEVRNYVSRWKVLEAEGSR